ncbi:hypothetical protein CRG98_022700 [Punica granatum]|uniref:RNase H type-1 domain-containing protein n=1 Tax=Punica granatum TaxID=22663 RepID=A0A2I0JKS0_PUNGR|nr:hypothetical protein CRG98_022700 [Punica granatum]
MAHTLRKTQVPFRKVKPPTRVSSLGLWETSRRADGWRRRVKQRIQYKCLIRFTLHIENNPNLGFTSAISKTPIHRAPRHPWNNIPISSSSTRMLIGARTEPVLRDLQHKWTATLSSPGTPSYEASFPLYAETQSALQALFIAANSGWNKIWGECDALLLVESILNPSSSPWHFFF